MFLDVAKDRLYTLAPDDPARRSAQTVLWQALHDLDASPPRRRWCSPPRRCGSTIPALLAECESVHLAALAERAGATAAADEEWAFLLGVRDAVNAAIEPLRAAKTLATTAEAEVDDRARRRPVIARLARLRRRAGRRS